MSRNATRGFTLIELVITIIVLAILAVVTTSYITQSVTAYQDTARRDQLASMGRMAIERIGRKLRNAHPSSVRVVNGGDCVEYMTIIGSGTYQDQAVVYPPASRPLPVGFIKKRFDAYALTVTPSVDDYIIAGHGSAYDTGMPRSRATFSSISTVAAGIQRIVLSANHEFISHSAARRFYVAIAPEAFCIDGMILQHYTGYTLNSDPRSGTPVLLAEYVQPGSLFNSSGATLVRNDIVQMDLTFMRDNEQVRLQHEVHIRNVP